MKKVVPHQYIERRTNRIMNETIFADRVIAFVYSTVRENAAWLFRVLTGPHVSSLLAFLNFDLALSSRVSGGRRFLSAAGINVEECVSPAEMLNTPRKIFERQIRYWDVRPLPQDSSVVVSPADSKAVCGSFASRSRLYLKNKLFHYDELLGDRPRWRRAFRGGDFAVFRLTPDEYHYNHSPVSGTVVDFYEINGRYHSCNPTAAVEIVTPHSKNKRTVTIIDTDVPRGSRVGLVALVEVVALMIGGIRQCYSDERYDAPRDVVPGLFMKRGQVKSLYRPGSSTNIVLFQKNRITFAADLAKNSCRDDVHSRLTLGFGRPLVETKVRVREAVARKTSKGKHS